VNRFNQRLANEIMMVNNYIKSRVYVFANTTQIIELEIQPSKIFAAESSLKYWIDEGITFKAENCVKQSQLPGKFGRLLKLNKPKPGFGSTGIIYFKNNGGTNKQFALAAPDGREILPIDILEPNGYFSCNKNAFMCASDNIEISIDRKSHGLDIRNHVLAQKGFILMQLRGQGKIFVHAGGRCIKKTLKKQLIRIDRRSIIGFESGIRYSPEPSGFLKSFQSTLAGSYEITLKGSGAIYLQTKPYIRKHSSNWLARGLEEILDAKSLQPYMRNLQTVKNMQWSKFRNTLLMNSTQKKKRNSR
jgi:uncharacterized protein (AIM24 family)